MPTPKSARAFPGSGRSPRQPGHPPSAAGHRRHRPVRGDLRRRYLGRGRGLRPGQARLAGHVPGPAAWDPLARHLRPRLCRPRSGPVRARLSLVGGGGGAGERRARWSPSMARRCAAPTTGPRARTALLLVSAWAEANRLVLGQVAVAPGSNEIPAIPALLQLLGAGRGHRHRRCHRLPDRHRRPDRRPGGRLRAGAEGEPADAARGGGLPLCRGPGRRLCRPPPRRAPHGREGPRPDRGPPGLDDR